MAGDDESLDDDGTVVEPEGGSNAGAEWELHEHLDVTAATTEVGGYEAQWDVATFLVDFDLDLDGTARMEAAIGCGWSGSRGLGVGRIHGSAPGLSGSRLLAGPWRDYRHCGWVSLGRAVQRSGYGWERPRRAGSGMPRGTGSIRNQSSSQGSS